MVESLIPKFDSTMKSGLVKLDTSMMKSEAMWNSITDGWKFPYMSCKFLHAVESTELMARFFSPFGPTATVSQVEMFGVCVGWHVVFPELMYGPCMDTLLKLAAHVQSLVRPSAPQFPGQQ